MKTKHCWLKQKKNFISNSSDNKMNNILPQIISKNWEELMFLIQKYQVEKLYIFGSVLNEKFDFEKSDLDFIVLLNEMPPLEKGENILNFWLDLEKLFQRKIDLITKKKIQNPFLKKSIEQTKMLIYDRKSEEISLAIPIKSSI